MSEAAQLFSDGEAYERMMGRWSRMVGEAFLDWLALPKGLRCVDVGCGNGAFTEVLMARAAPASVTGLDPSEGQIAFARQRPGAKPAEFRVGDAQVLPLDNASFDAALMALVVVFLPDPAKAAAEMARVVRPGGWVATYMWDLPGGGAPTQPIYNAFRSFGMSEAKPPNPEASRREILQALWQQAGLMSVETQVIRITTAYASFDDFWASYAVPVGPQGKAIAALSPDQRETFRARLREQLPTAADGSIRYEAFANAVKGRVPG